MINFSLEFLSVTNFSGEFNWDQINFMFLITKLLCQIKRVIRALVLARWDQKAWLYRKNNKETITLFKATHKYKGINPRSKSGISFFKRLCCTYSTWISITNWHHNRCLKFDLNLTLILMAANSPFVGNPSEDPKPILRRL